MSKTIPQKPKARNGPAHSALQSHFGRIADTLEDRVSEYLQMRKYMRVYNESQLLLEVKKNIDIAAGRVYEVNLHNKIDCKLLNQLMQILNGKNTGIKAFIQGKPVTLQLKVLNEISKNFNSVVINVVQISKDISRIIEITPIIKSILKMKDNDDRQHDPVLVEIVNALKKNPVEPSLTEIKEELGKQQDLSKYDNKLNFEHLNDISDKLIGLLNDKLLLILNVSETVVAQEEPDNSNDIVADQRLPDELRVLFLASSTIDIFLKIKEIKECLKNVFNNVRLYLQLIDSGKLDAKLAAMLNSGTNNAHQVILMTAKNLQKLEPVINEFVVLLEKVDEKKAIKIAYGLIYEKSNRTWENPYWKGD